MRLKIIVSAAALGTLVAACDMKDDDFTDEEWSQIKKLEPLAGSPPRNPFNTRDQDETLAKFGQQLFFDKDVAEAITVSGPSGNAAPTEIRKVACVNCHDTKFFADSHLTSVGATATNGTIPGLSHGRNYLATNTGEMVNLHWNEWTLWAGRFDGLVEHGTTVWGTSATVLAQARFVYLKYKDEYNAAFPDNQLDPRLGLPTTNPGNVFPATGNPAAIGAAPGPFEMMPADAQANIHQMRANLGRLFDTYPRMMLTPDSPFQRYVKGDRGALTGAQKRGLKLFIGKAACSDCHTGPTLTDNKFHNIGAPNVTLLPGSMTAVAPNRGRAGAVPAIVLNLNLVDKDDQAIVFNGAGKFSDDPELGRQRLRAVRDQDEAHCICRRTDAVADATACTATLVAGATQMALRGANGLDCLKQDDVDPSVCVCRKTDAVANVDACTDAVVNSDAQVALRTPDALLALRMETTRTSCMKYDDTVEGMFRTPQLLNVAETPPYFHSGAVQTLEEVIWHYNQGGGPPGTFAGKKSPQIRPLGLTEDEVHDLAEFLRSLTGKSPAQQAAEAKLINPDAWDWTKNTAKPPLTGLGGMGGSAAGAGGASGRGGASGTAGSSGAAGGTGSGGSGAGGSVGGATGSGGAGGGAGGATGGMGGAS